MDSSRPLFLILMVIAASDRAAPAEPTCEDSDIKKFNLLEGEAFHFVPWELHDTNLSDEQFTWYKDRSQIESISSDEKERIHRHSASLFVLNVSTEDSGFYSARYIDPLGECLNCCLKVDVFNASYQMNKALLYGEIKNSDLNKKVLCPSPVQKTCKILNGEFTWYKDFSILKGHHEAKLWVHNATKDHEGIYTCICTWKHNHMVYNSSGSRKLTFMVMERQKPHATVII